ncbi:biotin synthase auxiliary protein BsaP [Pseudarthrobacter sp. TAF60_1]|uniref:biotin synthase auxiliary protein BsaP n=1 Tax=Pseudarthrobacter sp. TAF60_1 TaxID=3233071 RepID=UPI003F9A1618
MSTGSTSAATTRYCGHCGEPTGVGAAPEDDCPTSDAHQSCAHRLAMEPPRYCADCRRRMKVQVTPLGWTAECSRHGSRAA